MAMAKDEGTAAGRGRNLDSRASVRSGGVVLYRSNFDQGMDGWTDMWGGYQPLPIVTRTSEICYRGSHCMMLSTGEHTPLTNDVSNFNSAFKRLGRHGSYRYHSFSAYLAVGTGQYNGAWDQIFMYIDVQKQDDTSRSFYQVRCSRILNGTYQGVTYTNAHSPWLVRGNSDLGSGEARMVAVPSSARSFIGNNENKWNFMYCRVTVDLAANGGLGAYKELQVGNQTFDLSSLGAGYSDEPPQVGSGLDIDDFAGGFNIGFAVGRNVAVIDGCQLFVDDVVLSASNTY